MTIQQTSRRGCLLILAAAACGCASKSKQTVAVDQLRPAPLGTISDSIWQQQEENAEASDFVIYEHEWVGNSTQLNAAGMEHVKQIAARAAETPFPVLIERASMSAEPGTRHGFPVNGNDDLDLHRREFIVHALGEMGVQESDSRVVVSPALTPGFQDFEAERAYNSGFSDYNNGASGFGGGATFGGFGGGGLY
ncbi:hypothetical protein GC163_17895 [bacterium]|nr:hypothetical protein [bacterium]